MNSLYDFAQRCLRRIIQRVISAPGMTMTISLVLAAIAIGYTISALEFETSRNAMVTSSARYIRIEKDLKNDFEDVEFMVVVIEPQHFEQGKEFVEMLATRLRADTRHFEKVVEKIDTSKLEGKKLLYLSPEELRTLRQRLEDVQDLLADLSDTPGLMQLLDSINQEISRAMVTHLTQELLGGASPAAETAPDEPVQSLDVSFLGRLFSEMALALDDQAAYLYRSPWELFFIEDGDVFSQEGYLTSKHDRFFYVLVDDRTTSGGFVKHASPLRALRAHLKAVRREFPDVQAGVTGGDALNTDEMLATQRDTIMASIIALIGVAVLFMVAFRQVWRPLLVVATLIIAICWTMGFTTLAVGHLNILTIAFIPIMIGLGIDFGIHLMARYGEARAQNRPFDVSIHDAYLNTGPGIIAAALTTAVAFYALMLTDFRGLVELGFIAGSGMLLCLVASFTVLPALMSLFERKREINPGVWQALPRDPLRGLKRFPRALLCSVILATISGVMLLSMPGFDYNLLNLQAQDTESVVWEHRLHEESGVSSWYALSVADSMENLRRKQAQFENLSVVDRVSSLTSVIPDHQGLRIPLIHELAPYVQEINADWQDPEPIDLEEVNDLLERIRFKLQRKATEWDPAKRPTEADLAATREALIAVQTLLRKKSPESTAGALETFQKALLADFGEKIDLLKRNLDPTPITVKDVPDRLKNRFIGKSGRYLLQIYASENIWDRGPMEAFVKQLEAVDENITGPPVIGFYSIKQIHQGYARGGVYALIAITGLVLMLFRRLKPTLLSLIPVLFGGLWTMICMALLHLQFNMANLIILPLIIGVAVDDGIHIAHRMQEDPEAGISPLARSTGKAIVLTSLTSMIGFGSLMVAKHAGVFSLGLLTTIAVGSSLIATLVVLPLVVLCLPSRNS